MNTKKLISLHVFVFLGILITFSIMFNYPLPISVLSMMIIASFYLGLNLVIGVVGVLTQNKSMPVHLIASSLYTITTCFILLIFALNFIGNSNWGTNVTFAFMLKYAQQLSSLESSLPIPLSVIYLILLTIATFIFVFYYKVIHHFSTPLTQLFKDITSSKGTVKQGIYLIVSIFFIPILLFFHQNFQHPTTDDIWDGEPFTDLFLPYTTITHNTNFIDEDNYQYPVTNSDITDKPNIIIIIADALRADHVGVYGYDRITTPFIDNLVNTKKAIKIDNAFSTCSESGCGILSTLGSRPYDEISRKNIKINNVLKAHDYDINFILSADHSWGGLDEHYPPYDLFYDGNSTKKHAPTDDQLVLEKLTQISSYKKPTFFYFHLMSNHPMGMRKRQFDKYTPTLGPHDWFYNLPIIRNIYNRDPPLLRNNYYDNGIVSTDYYISQIFNQLTKKGYMENSIVWIIADHGEAQGEHGQYGHVQSLYNEETRIPMIIVDSQLDKYKERFFATHMDIAPTILNRLNIKIPESWKGSSLLNKKVGTHITHHNIPSRDGDKGIIVKTDDNQIFKLLYNDKDSFKVMAIFNITKDLSEKHNLNKPENKLLINKLKAYALKNPYLGKIAGGLAEAKQVEHHDH